jgi:hypothetical protein
VAAELPAAPAADPVALAEAPVAEAPAAEPDEAMKLIRPATGTAARAPLGAPLVAPGDGDKSDA